MVGLIKRTSTSVNTNVFTALYNTMIPPTMGYANCIWSPYLIKDINLLENVQKQATRMCHELRNMTYPERLRALGLPTLQYRRLRHDMIQVFKLLHGFDHVDEVRNMLKPATTDRTRGHSFKLKKIHSRSKQHSESFSNRIIDNWNSLPEAVVTAKTVNEFKSKLNDTWKYHPLKFDV